MIAEFVLTVLYTHIVVALPTTELPSLLWSDEHVAQGFAWSPGIASFGVPDHDGQSRVIVVEAEAFEAGEETLWAVQTPFRVSVTPLRIGTLGDTHGVAVPIGTYNLVFEALAGNGADIAYVLKVHFIETETPDFAILKQGDELTTDKGLRRDADPG